MSLEFAEKVPRVRDKEKRKIESKKAWMKFKEARKKSGWTPSKTGRKPRTDLVRERLILHSAKTSASRKGIEINIDEYDIMIPEICPVLKIPIDVDAKRSYNSPSIDRIDPNKGYLKGNIQIISWRANLIKNNMTLEECELLLDHLRLINGVS